MVSPNELTQTHSSGNVIVEGEAKEYMTFYTEQGLIELREIIKTVEEGVGIKLVGNIGITSHFGNLLRLANIPSMIEIKKDNILNAIKQLLDSTNYLKKAI